MNRHLGALLLATAFYLPTAAIAAPHQFRISPQPLSSALEAFGRQGNVQIVFTPALVGGRTSKGVTGSFEPADALRTLLADSGLTFRPSGAGYVVLAASAAAPPPPAPQPSASPPVAPASDAGSEAVEQIVVTASRVVRSGFNSPTPTTMIGDRALQQRGAMTIAEALNDVPAFAPGTSTTTSLARPFAPGQNYANLRSLGATRTLVLTDGRRMAPTVPSFSTAGASQVDLNVIPPILLERAEIVTGGASAQWGSDAVAGVVNLILKKRFKGLQFDVEQGISQRSDNLESRVAVLAGTEFGKGRIVVAGEYYRNPGVGDLYTRPWGRENVQVVANPTPATNGLPATVIASGTALSTMTPGGLITAGPLRGLMFLPGGETTQFNYGNLVGNTLMVGGGLQDVNLGSGLKLVPSLSRYAIFSHAEYDLSSKITAFAEASLSSNHSLSYGIQPRSPGNITINVNNPFLPASVRTLALSRGVQTFSMGRISDDIGHITTLVRNRNIRLATGLNGSLGDGWSWDAYYQFGDNQYTQELQHQLITANFNRAVNAVLSNGQIVCQSTLTSPADGCVPINLFGAGSPSQAAINYVTGNSLTQTSYQQHVAAFNVRGEPLELWAGPVSLATGVEYREEQRRTTADPISIANGFNQQNPKPLTGGFHVTEGYVETVVPLAADMAWAKHLDFNAAARYAHYSSVGGQFTWKAGLTYNVNDWLTLRGVRSRDIRAPNVFELNSQPTPTTVAVIDPRTNTQVTIQQVQFGSPNLDAEKADTTSAGIGLKPQFLPGLQVNVDYYKIALDGAIQAFAGSATINLCTQTGDPFFCGNIVRNAAGIITTVNSPFVNLGQLRTEGVDLEIQYRRTLGPGSLSLRALGTYVLHSIQNNGFGEVDRAGEVGTANGNALPRFRGNLNVSYNVKDFTATVQLNYMAKSKYDATLVEGVGIQGNNIPSKIYTNVNVSYDFGPAGRYQVYGGVNNLFDVAPPNIPSTSFYTPTNAAYYDTIGRDFHFGFRAKF